MIRKGRKGKNILQGHTFLGWEGVGVYTNDARRLNEGFGLRSCHKSTEALKQKERKRTNTKRRARRKEIIGKVRNHERLDERNHVDEVLVEDPVDIAAFSPRGILEGRALRRRMKWRRRRGGVRVHLRPLLRLPSSSDRRHRRTQRCVYQSERERERERAFSLHGDSKLGRRSILEETYPHHIPVR